MTFQKKLFASAALLGFSLTTNAFDMEKDELICGIAKAIICDVDDECYEGSADTAELPLLISIRLKDKEIDSMSLSGNNSTSAILSQKVLGDTLVLQGAEKESGWSMTIGMKTAKMTLSTSIEEQGYIAFGGCTVR